MEGFLEHCCILLKEQMEDGAQDTARTILQVLSHMTIKGKITISSFNALLEASEKAGLETGLRVSSLRLPV